MTLAAADAALLSQLTIVVPSYQRPEALARLAAYYAPLPVQLVVVDGSAAPADPAAWPRPAGRLRYFHRPEWIDARVQFALGLVDTRFAMFSCDDEYYLAGGLAAALARLDSEPALSAVAGRCAAFVCNEHGLQLGTYYNFLKGYAGRQPLASQRVQGVTQHFPLLSGFYYSVCSARAFVPAAALAFSQRHACPYVQEILFTLALYMQGGMATVPDLVWMRNLQAPPVSNAQWNRKLDFSAWWGNAAHATEVARMLPEVQALYQRCLAPGEDAYPLEQFFSALAAFDARQAAGQGESQKAYPFALSAFLLLARQHGMPVDEASLQRVDRLETAPQLAASALAQHKARISVW